MPMNTIKRCLTAFLALVSIAATPAWAVSRSATGPSQPLPDDGGVPPTLAVVLPALEVLSSGSAALLPLAAADVPAIPVSALDASEPAGGRVVGKPIDDLSFVVRAAENGQRVEHSARDALLQLQDPQLKRLAEKLAHDRGDANARLSKLAEDKMWPQVPAHSQHAPPHGSASPDFDARWLADMIDAQELSVALYSAQARGGEDQDLRKHARDTLPIIQDHLAELRRLHK
jgi:putative membrane protein